MNSAGNFMGKVDREFFGVKKSKKTEKKGPFWGPFCGLKSTPKSPKRSPKPENFYKLEKVHLGSQ